MYLPQHNTLGQFSTIWHCWRVWWRVRITSAKPNTSWEQIRRKCENARLVSTAASYCPKVVFWTYCIRCIRQTKLTIHYERRENISKNSTSDDATAWINFLAHSIIVYTPIYYHSGTQRFISIISVQNFTSPRISSGYFVQFTNFTWNLQ